MITVVDYTEYKRINVSKPILKHMNERMTDYMHLHIQSGKKKKSFCSSKMTNNKCKRNSRVRRIIILQQSQ